jgi:oxygen-independent coproporphyrinogen-3 oxidase
VALGIYISVPFCRTKCSYCNFASDVFSRTAFERYVERVCADIGNATQIAQEMRGKIERAVDSIYLGGGTPTVLEAGQLERIFAAVRNRFDVRPDAEVTVECAPGTLAPAVIESLLRCGVNRVSLGVQSFVDAVATGVPHVSVYMLEVDEDSRLGRELIAGGTRFHAHFVPGDNAVVDFYLEACEKLEAAGVNQYEISNFARAGFLSRHNLKYWTRRPYLGFGVDAHSMLVPADADAGAARFATSDTLEQYIAGAPLTRTVVSRSSALEESFFLGLRLTGGVNLPELSATFGDPVVGSFRDTIAELVEAGLMRHDSGFIRLTARGRLVSNEVFEKFLLPEEVLRATPPLVLD